ncbi:hypothetical protein NOIMNB_NOIMNB_06515, partial [Dysosmobacter welbionis]
MELTGQIVPLVDRQFLFVQRLFHSSRGVFIDLHHLAHGTFPKPNRVSQLFAGIHRGRVDFRQCCQKSTLILIPMVRLLICLCPGLDLRLQLQGNFS